jgi:hypothetical protein
MSVGRAVKERREKATGLEAAREGGNNGGLPAAAGQQGNMRCGGCRKREPAPGAEDGEEVVVPNIGRPDSQP